MPINEVFLFAALLLPAVRETLAFGPSPVSQFSPPSPLTQKSFRQQRWSVNGGAIATGAGPLGMAMDPHDVITHAQTAADLLHDNGHHITSQAESPFTSLTTANVAEWVGNVLPHKKDPWETPHTLSDLVKDQWHYKWQFGKFHGPVIVDGLPGENPSIPPGWFDPEKRAEFFKHKDIFLPEDKEEALKAIKRQSEATLGQPSLTSDMLRDRSFGGKPEFFFDTPVNRDAMYAPLSAKDLDEIAHDGDIMSRLPMLAFAFVLIDFFFVNSGNDIYRDEIENDDEALRSEWVAQVIPRLGIGIVLALLTMWSSYTFYHPIPGV